MLNLRRHVGETVEIEAPNGEYITVWVSKISGKIANLTITAPPAFKIWRGELIEAKRNNVRPD